MLQTSFLLYQCLHGLGHALMIYTADRLPFALALCDDLTGVWAQHSCDGGVFMQNFNPPDALSPFQSTYIKPSDPIYPCNAVPVGDKLYCYMQITQNMLNLNHDDLAKVAPLCLRAERGWVGICYQSFGRDVSGFTQYQPRAALADCRLAGRYLGDCVFAVVRDYTNNDGNGTRAAGLCALSPAQVRGICYYGMGTILQTIEPAGSGLHQACQALAPAYLNECLGYLTPGERALLASAPANAI